MGFFALIPRDIKGIRIDDDDGLALFVSISHGIPGTAGASIPYCENIIGVIDHVPISLVHAVRRVLPLQHGLCLLYTSGNNDPEEWREIIGNKAHKDDMARKFKDNNSPLKIAIVVDMWLTGFDVPSLATMYVYKPMACLLYTSSGSIPADEAAAVEAFITAKRIEGCSEKTLSYYRKTGSYTHLDVYKRQRLHSASHGDEQVRRT